MIQSKAFHDGIWLPSLRGQGEDYFDKPKGVDYGLSKFIGENLLSNICFEYNKDRVQNCLGAYPN